MEYLTRLWDSAHDFQRVVIPSLRPWLPPGEFVPVEGRGPRALSVVDTVAGIDGWLVAGAAKLLGVASRVQYGATAWDSFTIRARLASGAPTELAKRREAFQSRDARYVAPEWTAQAYVTRARTGLLSLALLVRTADLYEFEAERPDLVQWRTNREDGTEFAVVWAQDLVEGGRTVYRVARPHIGVMRRDGWWYAVRSPFAHRSEGGIRELTWVPENFYPDQDAEDRACALAAALRACKPEIHTREDVLRMADRFYDWLRAA